MPPDAGTTAQRQLFAAVRENQFAVGADGKPRPAQELLADPGPGRHGPLPAGPVEDGRPQGRAARGVRPLRHRSRSRTASARPRCWARSGTSRPSCSPPGGGRSWKGSRPRTSPTSSRPTDGLCRPNGPRSSASSSSRLTARPCARAGCRCRPTDPGAALPELTALAAEVAAGKASAAGCFVALAAGARCG